MPATKLKLISIAGARPQFIKAMPLALALAASGKFNHLTLHTGQHYDDNMSDVFFRELGMPAPQFQLGISGGRHGEMTGRMLAAIEPVLAEEKPAAVIVYGDTNSTLAGALAAAKLGIPVAHVEAGMRSGNWKMPEEINRIVADRLSQFFFCASSAAVENLRQEGVVQNVHQVGDLMYDTFLLTKDAATDVPEPLETHLALEPKSYAVATIHRAENTDDGEQLTRIFDYLAAQSEGMRVIMPVHPRLKTAREEFGVMMPPTVMPVSPLGYLDMYRLLRGATTVFTDSGGLQKEAYFHRVPCVTLRTVTEWKETIASGWNRLWTAPDYLPRRDITEYGHGHAAAQITNILANALT